MGAGSASPGRRVRQRHWRREQRLRLPRRRGRRYAADRNAGDGLEKARAGLLAPCSKVVGRPVIVTKVCTLAEAVAALSRFAQWLQQVAARMAAISLLARRHALPNRFARAYCTGLQSTNIRQHTWTPVSVASSCRPGGQIKQPCSPSRASDPEAHFRTMGGSCSASRVVLAALLWILAITLRVCSRQFLIQRWKSLWHCQAHGCRAVHVPFNSSGCFSSISPGFWCRRCCHSTWS